MDKVIYLDVDGVLNPITSKCRSKHWGDYKKYEMKLSSGGSLRIWLSKEMGRALWDLAARHGAEIVWSTTWLQDANTCISPVFDWPEIRVLSYNPIEDFDNDNCGKLPVVGGDSADKAVVWIDDYLGPVDRMWVLNRLEIGKLPTMGIKPVSTIGLVPSHLEKIDEFFSSLER